MHINNNNLPKKILSWYDNNKRTLPWRIKGKSQKHQYYRILSEFMLQQTHVKTVIPYFNNFVKKIPSLKALSKTNKKQVLKLWEGLGYYRRAKNLHISAKILVKQYDSKIPNSFEEIKKLPGVGEYTANILLALIYNQPRIGIDGNVKRILERIFNQSSEKSVTIFKLIFKKSILSSRNADIAEALMEFGAIICTPKNPKCDICNLKFNCNFFKKKINIKHKKKYFLKEKNYNIFCYIQKNKKQIALTKNKELSFLHNLNIPETKIVKLGKNDKVPGWIFLCNYKNNISNTKMNINLFYKFIKSKPQHFKWHSIDKPGNAFIPSFTKKIINKLKKVDLEF